MGASAGLEAARRLLAGASIAGLALALLPGASATTYSDSDGRYSFDYPALWTASSRTGVDVAILGPSDGGFGPNIESQHGSEPAAQNSGAWLLRYVQLSLGELKGQVNVTEVAGPRTFAAGSGRLAGDYLVEREEGGLHLRQRQVFFVSASFGFTFVLTFTDKVSTYSDHDANWSLALDSFAVQGESGVSGAAGAGGGVPFGTLLSIAGGAALVGSLVFMVVSERRRGRPKEAQLGAPRPVALRPQELGGGPTRAPAATPGEWLPARVEPREPIESGEAWSPVSPPRRQGPAPGSEPLPVSLGGARVAEQGSPAPGTAKVGCPRCRRAFEAQRRRPLAVVCPFCGAKGTLR